MKLKRNSTTGKIHDDDDRGRPVLLCGGTYHVFAKYNGAGYGLAHPGQTDPFTIDYQATEPCVVNPEESVCSAPSPPPPRFKARLLTWSPDDNWAQLFTTLGNTKCNLLRVWVMGGTSIYPPRPGVDPNTDPPFDLYPFAPVKSGGVWKWKVAAAVENDVWNQPFFKRLVDFVDAANAHGVCVLLTLFNYYDFANDGNSSFKSWSRSPWNPTLSINPPGQPDWDTDHLVNPETSSFPERNTFFIKPTNRLRDVQTAFVRKFVKTLRGKGNVIFEIMNEPRFAHHKDMSRFNSDMVTAVNDEAGTGSPPLIAVNASYVQNGDFDTDWWRTHSTPGTSGYVPNYDRVDVLTYHGMTGFDNHDHVPGNAPNCRGKSFSVPPVDPTSMTNRINEHKNEQAARTKKNALMFSTDAARIEVLEHLYCDTENRGQRLGMHVRDGQIDTHYPHANRDTAPQKALKSDLRNWAFWFFKRAAGAANLGLVHFQNHSSFEAAFQKILKGRQEAAGPAAAGEISDTPSEETDDASS